MTPEPHPVAAAPADTHRKSPPQPESPIVLEQLTARCVAVLDVAAAAVLLNSPGGGLRVAAATGPGSHAVERFAAATDTGPGVDALRTGAQVSCPHIDRDTTAWPGYAAAARRGGFRAAHALPLRHHGQLLGALSLFDTRARTLDPDRCARGQVLADTAATALIKGQDAGIIAPPGRHPHRPRTTPIRAA